MTSLLKADITLSPQIRRIYQAKIGTGQVVRTERKNCCPQTGGSAEAHCIHFAWQPLYHGRLSGFRWWLCVPVFRQVCPSATVCMNHIGIGSEKLKGNHPKLHGGSRMSLDSGKFGHPSVMNYSAQTPRKPQTRFRPEVSRLPSRRPPAGRLHWVALECFPVARQSKDAEVCHETLRRSTIRS